jgi:hypothetical protein
LLSKVYEIRRLTIKLEENIKNGAYPQFKSNCDAIEELVNSLRHQFKVENQHIVRRYEQVESQEFKSHEINKLEFLFKPVTTRNVYEGSYIESYAVERTEQLKAANALKEHNEFWSSLETLYGTVYGSVPVELIAPSSAAILQKLGWVETMVKILDFGKIQDRSVFVDYCKDVFESFIIVVEKETDTYLVIEFESRPSRRR